MPLSINKVFSEQYAKLKHVATNKCSKHKIKKATFLLGSYLTEPLCKGHESYRKISLVNELHPEASKTENLSRKFFLVLRVFGWGSLGLLTTLPGILLRKAAASSEKEPFIEVKGATAKDLPEDRQISLLSWNVCCVGAGYPITDGGVMPREYRYDAIIEKIVETDADVNCLYEVFDVVTAEYFKNELKKQGYTHFYYNIGPRAIGVSSALFVASKYEIGDPEFTAFPKSSLVGRTKNSEKGVFAFSVMDGDQSVVRILTTHLQHSETPGAPAGNEIRGRKDQIEIIQGIADKILVPVIITGDLNMDDSELDTLECLEAFSKGDLDLDKKTWGGDQWCARSVGKWESDKGQNLDHVLARGVELTTRIAFETGYDQTVFKKEAISDHEPLLSTFIV